MYFLIAFGLIGLALLVWGIWVLFPRKVMDYGEGELKLRDRTFHVAIAETALERTQGLSSREELTDSQGMYFIFPISMKYGFWMKDMKFPIDILWIKEDRVVGVTQDVPPPKEGSNMLTIPTYYPSEAVDRVLELRAGLAKEIGVAPGDIIQLTRSESK